MCWQPVPELLDPLDHKVPKDLPDLKGNRVLKGLLDLLDRQDPLDQPHQPQKSRLPSYPAPNVTMTPL